MPRDVEALERVVEALGADVSDEVVAHERILHSLVDSLDLAYGAAWLPDHRGGFVLRATAGNLAPTMAAAWTTGDAMVAGAGYGGQALRSKATVLMDASSDTSGCPRWATAAAAGAGRDVSCPSSRAAGSPPSSSTTAAVNCPSSEDGRRSGRRSAGWSATRGAAHWPRPS